MDKTCFAYTTEENGCMALSDAGGCGPDCPFRKGMAEHEAARLNADRRLASLPRVQQQYIADTYYNGIRPWLKTTWKAVGV